MLRNLTGIRARIRFAARRCDAVGRPVAMHAKALSALADVRGRHEAFLADARSVLDRPLLADDTHPATEAFHRAYAAAAASVGFAVPTEPRLAAEGLAAAESTRNAFIVADQHAHRMARQGIYPGGVWLDYRGLDRIDEARASLELAAQADDPVAAADHRNRAVNLAAAALHIPAALGPAWQALTIFPAVVVAR